MRNWGESIGRGGSNEGINVVDSSPPQQAQGDLHRPPDLASTGLFY